MIRPRRPSRPGARRAITPCAAGLLLGAFAAAQEPEVRQEPEPDPLPAARAAIDAWIGADLEQRDRLDAAVAAVLAAGQPGLRLLAEEIARTGRDDRRRLVAVESLTTNTILGFVQRAQESGMVYAGQYDDLRILQPAAGRFLLKLVADTPDWFPDDMRPLVVPALRDVFPAGPSRAELDRLTAICADEDFESAALRDQLAYALAGWGQPRFVEARLDELTRGAGEGRSGDELWFVRELARLRYQLRDYPRAADRWQRYIDGSRALGNEPRPIELYDAACCLSLAQRPEPALAAIESCLAAVAAGRSDSSATITRQMLDTDPDLRLIRPLPRFGAAVRAAFADRDDTGGEPPRSGREERRERPDHR